MNRESKPTDSTLSLVSTLLDAGKAGEAADVIRRNGCNSPELRNAYGVCLMRAGEVARAVEVFRELVLYPGSVCLQAATPTRFKTNFATALLLTDNVVGCLSMLHEAQDELDPRVMHLRAAIARWKRSLTWWQRLRFRLNGSAIVKPVPLDFQPGEIIARRELHPAA